MTARAADGTPARTRAATQTRSPARAPSAPEPRRQRMQASQARSRTTSRCSLFYPLSTNHYPLFLQNPHPLAHALQRLQRLVEFLARMRCRHDRPYARLALRHRWERDARAEYAFVEQRPREVHSEPAIANDDRRNRRLAGWSRYPPDVEAQPAQLFLPVMRVGPQIFNTLRFLFQHVERRDARRRH